MVTVDEAVEAAAQQHQVLELGQSEAAPVVDVAGVARTAIGRAHPTRPRCRRATAEDDGLHVLTSPVDHDDFRDIGVAAAERGWSRNARVDRGLGHLRAWLIYQTIERVDRQCRAHSRRCRRLRLGTPRRCRPSAVR